MIPADVIVVLGCVVEPSGAPSRALARRVALGAHAFHAGVAPRVLACGGRSWHGHVEALVMKRELVAAGVPAGAVALELCSLTTAENARYGAEWLRAHGAESAALASCHWHLPRATAGFRRAGVTVVPLPSEWLVGPPAPPWLRLRERWCAWLDARTARAWARSSVALGVVAALGCAGCEGVEPAGRPTAGDASASVAASTGDDGADGGAAPAVGAVAERLDALLAAELDRRADLVLPADAASRDARVRRAAARALARIGGAGARPGLLRALVDEDDEVVAWAAYGLGFSCEGERDKTVRALVAAGAARLGASVGPTGAPVKNRGRLDATRAVVRAVGACAAEESETVLAEWTADARIAIDAAYALGDVATAREKLREDTYVTLLNLAAGDAAHDPLPEALYALGRVKTLPPSVAPHTLEVARARLAQAGPARVFAVRALGRVEDGAVAPLEEVLRAPERFTPVERAEAARALSRLGRAGQKALARALAALAPKALDAAPAAELVGESFGVLLALLESMGEIGEARPTLGALARLEPPKDAAEPVRRRVSWLRCSAAKLLAERNYADEALQKCDLASSAAGPGWIGQKHVVEALGIAGAELTGARHAAWRRFALEGELRAREAAVALVADHPELDDAAVVLAAALRAKEPGLQATAAEVLAKEPTRARVAPPKKKKPPPTEAPVHPDIAAALAERLAATDVDLEALGTALDAAGALGLGATRDALMTHCRSPYPSIREHAGKALAALDGSRTPVACDAAASPGPRAPEREHLLAAPVSIRFASDVGELVLELDPSLAPVAVTRLADLARSGFFDGIVVHRVVPGFVSQLGSPTADGYGGAPLPPLRCETTPMPFEAGSVGIALAGRDTGGSQFFVTHALYPHLDGRYAWLGRATGPWSALAEGDRIGAARVQGP